MSTTLPTLREDEHGIMPAEQGRRSLLDVLSIAASDPRVDVVKMQAILDMSLQVQREEARRGWHDAMARLQPKLPRITKRGQILSSNGSVRSTYAPIEDIDAECRPLYTAEGFSVFYTTKLLGEVLEVACHVSRSGHTETTTIPIPVEKGSYGNSAAQGMGITRSYGRRIAFCDAFNIITVGEDQDGKPEAFITEQQQREIEDWMQETNAKLPNVLKFAKVEKLSEIRQGAHFKRVVEALKDRKGQRA